jgi:hypothetical protein
MTHYPYKVFLALIDTKSEFFGYGEAWVTIYCSVINNDDLHNRGVDIITPIAIINY